MALITLLTPDILVKGGDYQLDEIVGREVVLARGGQVLALPFVPGYSTTGSLTASAPDLDGRKGKPKPAESLPSLIKPEVPDAEDETA